MSMPLHNLRAVSVIDDVAPISGRENRDCLTTFIGLATGFLSGVSFAVADIFVLLCITIGYSPAQILLVKSLVTLLALMPYFTYKKINLLELNRKDTLLNITKSLCENGADVMYYYAFDMIGLGDTTAIVVGTLPIFTSILAYVLIREKFELHDCVNVLLNVAGIVLISRPVFIFGNTIHSPAFGYVYAILTGLGIAIGTVCSRVMSDGVSLIAVVNYNALGGAILMTILLYPTSDDPLCSLLYNHPITVVYLVVTATLYFAYLYTYNRSLQILSAGKVAIITNISVVISFIADIIVFNRKAGHLEILGSVFIIVSSVIIVLFVWLETRSRVNEEIRLIQIAK
ncbi:solute carrier family 35 member G1-like [Saccoglossus kowalevskii]|uniref:Solute carrier family 35 member G1-like n=1 Tax=Saccoglossus kowalevskii TaxID=10224 RepID=A0ABM0M5Q2_SACKO|nr:PREDICTED: solute carrier family 35 member G1-like [Saccoglossus kowalevskii]